MDLRKLFYPESLAVIGASNKRGKLGYNVLRNLIEHGYEGEIYPVNRRYTRIQGLESFSNVGEIDGVIDAAVSIVPARNTPDVVRECFEKGIEFVSVQSAGFREKKGVGREIEEELQELIREYDFHILGPNCTGVINVNNGLCQSIGRVGELRLGNVGLIAQAGVYAAGILWGLRNIMDFSMIATIGNKLDIDETDILEYMGNEDSIEVITLYIEDIKRGDKFLNLAKKIIDDKPIILLKGGRTREGSKTAITHTGSIGGIKEVYDSIFNECGIITTRDNEHMFDIARAFSKQSLPKTKDIMIITYSGSQGITATDTLNENGLNLVKFDKEIKRKIMKFIPDITEGVNPADLTFNQKPGQVRKIIDIVKDDEKVGGFILNLQPEILREYIDELRELDSLEKPILISVTGREFVIDSVIDMENIGVPVFSTPERAADVISEMWNYKSVEMDDESWKRVEAEYTRVEEIIGNSLRRGKYIITGCEALEVLKAYGIPTIESYVAEDPEHATEIFEELNVPIAMKIESNKVIHKTDVGGLELDVKEDVSTIFKEIINRVISETGVSRGDIDGVSIQPMINDGKEVLIGSSYDDVLRGHMIKLGLGGKYTEIFNDISMRTVPLSIKSANKMIEETEYLKKMIKGVRGEEPCNKEIIVNSLIRLSQLVMDFPEIKEIEANPLIIYGDNAAVVDSRLRISE